MISLGKDIFEKIRQGDKKAFELVYKTYYSLLCVYAFDILKNSTLAEEIVQETFIKIWENKSKIDINTGIKSYLYKSVHNQCINLGKHLQVVKSLADKYTEDTRYHAELLLLANEEFTFDELFYDGIDEDVKEAIQSLPEQCRNIFVLNRFQNLSYTKIATHLNLSVNTVKTQMGRALDKLRIYIERKMREHQN